MKHIVQIVMFVYLFVLAWFAWEDVCKAQRRIDDENSQED